MLIFHTGFYHGDINRVELVDGQQRITTLTLLLLALKKRYDEQGNLEKANEINKMLTCKGYDEVAKNKLLLGDLDNEDYETLVVNGDLERIKNKNLLNAFKWFYEWFEEYQNTDLNRFYYKLTNVAIVIRLDVGMAQDAYKLFETINNRGLRLTPTDIIKNFLLGHAAKLSSDTLDKVKKLWAAIIVNLDGIDTDDFFRQYMCSILNRKISKTMLIHEFKSWYFKKVKESKVLAESVLYTGLEEDYDEDYDNAVEETQEEGELAEAERVSVLDLLDDIKKASNIYQKIVYERFDNPIVNRHLYNLNRILSVPTYIYLIHLFQKGLPDKLVVEILKVLETFMMRRHICEMRTSEHDDIFAKIVGIAGDNYLQTVKDFLAEYLPDDILFKDSLPKYDFKGILINRAKYILEMIEYRRLGNTGEFSINGSAEVHLEHIIPETINTRRSKSEFGDWETYLGENAGSLHRKYVHKIGNMTLLSRPLNISASNNPFNSKKEHYCRSSIGITQELVAYEDFRFGAVEQRGKKLAEIGLQIWSF